MASLLLYSFLLVLFFLFQNSWSQQSYLDNKQFDCDKNWSIALGFVCNGAARSCRSYHTFRSIYPYNSPFAIAYLFNTSAAEVARINHISDVGTIPDDNLAVVPVTCSCSGQYYQHNASYALKTDGETYYSVANETYQGLTTCQSLTAQNSYNYNNLLVGMNLHVPVRCACPTLNQTRSGFKYLLAYYAKFGDTCEAIADTFDVDVQSIYDANELFSESIIYPFTPLLIPLKSEPTHINTSLISLPPPPSPPQILITPAPPSNSSSHKWIYVGVGVGVGVLLICFLILVVICFFRYRNRRGASFPGTNSYGDPEFVKEIQQGESRSWSDGVKHAIQGLITYKYDDLQMATDDFSEANRIKGSVFRGKFNGDYAAVKMIKGEALEEITAVKQINHSNIIRLSGCCLHDGFTYLVYEYAEGGSLHDLLHTQNKGGLLKNSKLTWKHRIQIACDIADGLDYLHNYANPPYIHKNLKSSNVVLDGNMRAKVSNFSLARTLNADKHPEGEEGRNLQMTRHVVGTHGYMAPEYIENGLVTPKLDVFAVGVVILELLSGREVVGSIGGVGKDGGEEMLSAAIEKVLDGENAREKLQQFMDPQLGHEYPLDLAYPVAELAKNCVAGDLNARPRMPEVYVTLSKILSSSLDWDPLA